MLQKPTKQAQNAKEAIWSHRLGTQKPNPSCREARLNLACQGTQSLGELLHLDRKQGSDRGDTMPS